MIFDRIIRASGESLGDVFPSISKRGVEGKERGLFLKRPGRAGDGGGELVVPPDVRSFLPLSNLLGCARPRHQLPHVHGNRGPLSSPVLLDEAQDQLVLLDYAQSTSEVHNFLSPIFSLQTTVKISEFRQHNFQITAHNSISIKIIWKDSYLQHDTKIQNIRFLYKLLHKSFSKKLKTIKTFISQRDQALFLGWRTELNQSVLKFSNKMKVYSASKVRRSSLQLNEAMRSNIEQLATLLKSSSSQTLSLSPSMQSATAEEEAINLSKQFVANLSDPFQCMILYPLVLDCAITCQSDPLFQFTSFPEELHSLLTLYLYKCTSYASLDRNSRKIIDLFYRYVNEEAREVYQVWLSQQNRTTLGEWFYTECISSFFQLIYKQRDLYTIFVINYLKYGLPYLFVCAVSALKGNQGPLECDSIVLDKIRAAYLQKFGIE